MRPCLHMITGDTPSCSLGVSPMKCSSCTMYQMQSRRTSQQVQIKMDNGSGYVPSNNGVITGTINTEMEQNIVARSAVSGGCGCKRG